MVGAAVQAAVAAADGRIGADIGSLAFYRNAARWGEGWKGTSGVNNGGDE